MISKFRPVLNAAQIRWILNVASKDDSHVAKSRMQSLALFNFKIENDLIKPSAVSITKQSLHDSLGFSETIPDTNSDAYRWTNNLMTPEEETAYENSLNRIAKGA